MDAGTDDSFRIPLDDTDVSWIAETANTAIQLVKLLHVLWVKLTCNVEVCANVPLLKRLNPRSEPGEAPSK